MDCNICQKELANNRESKGCCKECELSRCDQCQNKAKFYYLGANYCTEHWKLRGIA